MSLRRRIFAVIAASFALLALALNGAQAHLATTSSDGTLFHVCSPEPQSNTPAALGHSVPASSETETCCGDCVSAAAIAPPLPPFQALGLALQEWAISPSRSQVRPGAPLWPGAPPHGPPTLL